MNPKSVVYAKIRRSHSSEDGMIYSPTMSQFVTNSSQNNRYKKTFFWVNCTYKNRSLNYTPKILFFVISISNALAYASHRFFFESISLFSQCPLLALLQTRRTSYLASSGKSSGLWRVVHRWQSSPLNQRDRLHRWKLFPRPQYIGELNQI